jgi:hypothetical protein
MSVPLPADGPLLALAETVPAIQEDAIDHQPDGNGRRVLETHRMGLNLFFEDTSPAVLVRQVL